MTKNYVINKTNGSVLTTILAGTADNTSDLTLIGRNYIGFGEVVNENFVKLLENFANSAAPLKPLAGQIWYDSSTSLLKYYDGSEFKQTAGFYFQSITPDNPVDGEFWFNTLNNKFFAYYNGDFRPIGEDTVTLTKTGLVSDVVTDTVGIDHRVAYLVVNDKRVAYISSSDTFIPQTAIQNFPQIKKGITLSDEVLTYFNGTASVALSLRDESAGQDLLATQFLRADVRTTATGPLNVTSQIRVDRKSTRLNSSHT